MERRQNYSCLLSSFYSGFIIKERERETHKDVLVKIIFKFCMISPNFKDQFQISLTAPVSVLTTDERMLLLIFFSVALRPNAGHGLLIREVFLDHTQYSQQTNIHAPGGIRTHDLSRRAAIINDTQVKNFLLYIYPAGFS